MSSDGNNKIHSALDQEVLTLRLCANTYARRVKRYVVGGEAHEQRWEQQYTVILNMKFGAFVATTAPIRAL